MHSMASYMGVIAYLSNDLLFFTYPHHVEVYLIACSAAQATAPTAGAIASRYFFYFCSFLCCGGSGNLAYASPSPSLLSSYCRNYLAGSVRFFGQFSRSFSDEDEVRSSFCTRSFVRYRCCYCRCIIRVSTEILRSPRTYKSVRQISTYCCLSNVAPTFSFRRYSAYLVFAHLAAAVAAIGWMTFSAIWFFDQQPPTTHLQVSTRDRYVTLEECTIRTITDLSSVADWPTQNMKVADARRALHTS